MSPTLYWRQFTRGSHDDVDHVADDKFLSQNFVDMFGKWLQEGDNASKLNYHDLVTVFWDGSQAQKPLYEMNTYLVADGSVAGGKYQDEKWFSPQARFITIVHLPKKEPFNTPENGSEKEWTLCIVGSSQLKDDAAFLQVASWDGTALRFYQKDTVETAQGYQHAWIYFGNSVDAFGANEYLGPFNGHVNGACVMKELREPWIHWFDIGENRSDFTNCFSEDTQATFREAPYLTEQGRRVFSQLTEGPAIFEKAITNGVSNWFHQHQKNDFFDAESNLLQSPSNIQRWVAHLLLTTTVNIVAAKPDQNSDSTYIIPHNHFYNQELLSYSDLLPDERFKVTMTVEDYEKAVGALGLSILHQVDFEGPDVIQLPSSSLAVENPKKADNEARLFKVMLKNTEGQSPFNILQSSYEDAQGVSQMQTLEKGDDYTGPNRYTSLFSPEVYNALVMLDFCNPIYSWKRGVLMQYVPKETTLHDYKYDLEDRFIKNVENSHYVKTQCKDSPECEFLDLLKVKLESHKQAIHNYFEAVKKSLSETATKEQALYDNLLLAESRRRTYRPLPLNEFDSSMPYATKIHYEAPVLEMTMKGTIRHMPQRGVEFLRSWVSSLASYDPKLLPPINPEHNGPVVAASLPRPALLSFPDSGMSNPSSTSGISGGCPFFKKAKATQRPAKPAVCPVTKADASYTTGSCNRAGNRQKPSLYPTWETDILPLIKDPYWIPTDQRAQKSDDWIAAMKVWGKLDLGKYEDVSNENNAMLIYRHLRSRTMPIMTEPNDYWPDDALDIFRLWANSGFRRDSSCPPSPKLVITKAQEPQSKYRIRKDIMTLNKEELAVYQSKLEDILHVSELGSKWQELGLLHADWCLHNQEGTFLWYRAYLRYVEDLIDFPIPYWNGFGNETSNPDSRFSGVPPVFFEETYVHPKDGSVRPNPLKYALSLHGKSISRYTPSRFVVRNPTLEQRRLTSPRWKQKIQYFELYHQQIAHALSQSTYSASDVGGGNTADMGDDFKFNFDGLFEQAHNNFYGWIGPDMSNNTHAAFDPIFLSYHANMDRLAGMFMESHPTSQYAANFPLRPFQDNGARVNYHDTRHWKYTTIGDMAKDTRALGYIYSPPLSPDMFALPIADRYLATCPKPTGGQAIALPQRFTESASAAQTTVLANRKTPFIVFSDVGYTTSSYRVDVFAPEAESLEPDFVDNPDYIGHITRIGMGMGAGSGGETSTQELRMPKICRAISAKGVADRLSAANKTTQAVKITVTNLVTDEQVPEAEYRKLPGFEPKVIWVAETS